MCIWGDNIKIYLKDKSFGFPLNSYTVTQE